MVVPWQLARDLPIAARELHATPRPQLADRRAIDLLPRRLVERVRRHVRRPPARGGRDIDMTARCGTGTASSHLGDRQRIPIWEMGGIFQFGVHIVSFILGGSQGRG